MSTIVCLRVETWGDKFIVVGEIGRLTSIYPHQYDTYIEALKEVSKLLMREVLRYEAGLNRDLDR